MLPVLIVADEFADVCATGLEAPVGDLFVDERREGVRQGDARTAHVARVAGFRMSGRASSGGRPEAVGPLVRYGLDEIARMHDPDAPLTGADVSRTQGWLFGAVWQWSLELATDASRTFAIEAMRQGDADRLMSRIYDRGGGTARRSQGRAPPALAGGVG